nr:hypothetical protein L204_00282 [Cryptococcus depauperatus CBS 7855]
MPLATAESQEKVLVYGEDGKITGYKYNNVNKHKMCVVFDDLGKGLDVEMSADFKTGTRLSGSRAAKPNPIKYKQQRINAQGSTSDRYGLRFAGAGIACKWPSAEELATAVDTTEWDFAGSSIMFFVGRDKSGMMKTRVGFIDFTHTEPQESELSPEGIQEGSKTLDRLLKKRASELKASLVCLDKEIISCHDVT